MLENDLGVLGQVERDDDAEMRIALHAKRSCIARAARISASRSEAGAVRHHAYCLKNAHSSVVAFA
jgi:hypothetical protein